MNLATQRPQTKIAKFPSRIGEGLEASYYSSKNPFALQYYEMGQDASFRKRLVKGEMGYYFEFIPIYPREIVNDKEYKKAYKAGLIDRLTREAYEALEEYPE